MGLNSSGIGESNFQMPQAGGPILRLLAKVQCDFAKCALASADSKEILVEPGFGVPIEQAPGK
jgi:hypothetical protein